MTLLKTIRAQRHHFRVTVDPDGAAEAASTVIAIEESAKGDWRVVEARIDASGVAVRKAYRVDARPATVEANGHARITGSIDHVALFIPDARQSVCRLLDMPAVPQPQLEQMVALRLEVELPYPPSESMWACRGLPGDESETAPVLLIAQNKAAILEAETQLHIHGVERPSIVYAPSALVELARLEADNDSIVAVAKIDRDRGVLAIMDRGALRYARQLRLHPERAGTNGASEQWLHGLARELKQCLFDYAARTGSTAPRMLRVEGEGIHDTSDCLALETALEMPVALVAPPELLTLDDPDAVEGDLAAEYAMATGALLGLYRERAGLPTAAPALRPARSGSGFRLKRSVAQLLAVNGVLLAALLASFFLVRNAQLAAADRFVRESKGMVQDMEVLKEEVDILRYEEGQHLSMLELLMALSDILPGELKVESLNVDTKGSVIITGTTKSVETVADGVKEALQRSPRFKNPQFKGATQSKDEYGFTLTFELVGGGA